MTFDDVADLFMKRSPLNMSLKDVTYCFGMSKQTVVNEQDDRECTKYNQLFMSEFYEMIARVANMKVNSTEIKLCQKIEYILDDLFTTVKDSRRNPVVIKEIFEDTESDSDY